MIRIIDDWYVTVDSYPINYVVRRGDGRKDKKGKWLDRSRGYFGSLRNAVEEIRRQIVAERLESEERTLEQALSAISAVDTRFEKIMEHINT